MSFADAVKAGFKNWRIFRGVSSRSAFWYFRLFIVLAGVVTSTIDGVLAKSLGANQLAFIPIQTIANLILVVPDLSISVRRFRDAGFSGFWLLTWLTPFVFTFMNWDALAPLLTAAWSGAEPPAVSQSVALAAFALLLLIILVMVFTIVIWVLPTKTFEHGNRFAKPVGYQSGDQQIGDTTS